MKWIVSMVICLMIFIPMQTVGAEETADATTYMNDIDYSEVQQVMDNLSESQEGFDFSTYVGQLVSGQRVFSAEAIFDDMMQAAGTELKKGRGTIVQLLLIGVIAAVFTNFANAFQGKQISETGFYITYMLLFSVLMVSFCSVTRLAGQTLSNLLEFMKALVPAYCMSIAFSTGTSTSMVFYQATVVLITIVDVFLIKIIIPAINIYFIISLVNNMSIEDRFSKMTELMETVITWGLKALMGGVIGFHTIQGLVVPFADYTKRSLFTKAASAIPGAGNAIGAATQTVLGASILVKNAVGVAGLFAIILICAVPLAKLLSITFIYKFSAGVIQPISDKRILACMNATAQSAKLLLFTVLIGAVLFLFSIAIVTSMSSIGV